MYLKSFGAFKKEGNAVFERFRFIANYSAAILSNSYSLPWKLKTNKGETVKCIIIHVLQVDQPPHFVSSSCLQSKVLLVDSAMTYNNEQCKDISRKNNVKRYTREHREDRATKTFCSSDCISALAFMKVPKVMNFSTKGSAGCQFESRGFRISRSKIKYVYCRFSQFEKREVKISLDEVAMLKCKNLDI